MVWEEISCEKKLRAQHYVNEVLRLEISPALLDYDLWIMEISAAKAWSS